ncbi:NAD(P)H:quinone oxidoreductase, type IV [Kwoniella shandongensis]|uniref:NAD(P)H:quinone oxidoreductase, type IV n=1 Tax=Kwoniella shandongensis TaxID=1734106 RepID=A0A5M6BZJ9_9TREE|nr:NAD(P)H:quinone oxidoreductase, type IV [Kwoniella shandongensis]KAA5528224.1 NAD(P)H:quinone oxidoreductase, type IV [Kwoniella shandongensis]
MTRSTTTTTTKPVIAVAFYSTYGHIATLAEEVIKGVESTGAIVKPYFIKETLPEEVLTKMYAGQVSLHPKYPIITPNDLKEVDGLILGAPTRYGRLPAQVDAFLDATGSLWAAGALVGKFATIFTSCAGQHSGHESTILSTIPFFAHHGISYVPIGYACPAVASLDAVQGTSPYGASTIAGPDGSRQPIANELEVAQFQGKYFANFVGTFVRGKHAATAATASPAPAQTSTAAVALQDLNLGEPITASHVGEKETKSTADAGYAVDNTAAASAPAPAPATEPTPEVTSPAAAATAAETTDATSTQPSTQTATPAEKATTAEKPAPATTPAAAPKKKKGGLFASCCGGNGIDD